MKKVEALIDSVFYYVKDTLDPWNVIKLRALDKSWSEVDVRMEHCIFQLLSDFYDGEQPLHNCEYETAPITVDRHRELLHAKYGPGAHRRHAFYSDAGKADEIARSKELFDLHTRLLNIVEAYREGKYNFGGHEAFIATSAAGGEIRDAIDADRAREDSITDDLVFVVKNRGYLWT